MTHFRFGNCGVSVRQSTYEEQSARLPEVSAPRHSGSNPDSSRRPSRKASSSFERARLSAVLDPCWRNGGCYNQCDCGLGRVEPNIAQITGLLQAWACGDSEALEALMPLVYGELQQIAHRQMRRERVGHTLQTRPS